MLLGVNWWKFTSKSRSLVFKRSGHKTCRERWQMLSALGKRNSSLCCGPPKLWNDCDLLDVKTEIKWGCNSTGSALSEFFLNSPPPPFFLIIFFLRLFSSYRKSNFKDTIHKKTPCTLQASGHKQKISQMPDDGFENITAPLLSFHLCSLESVQQKKMPYQFSKPFNEVVQDNWWLCPEMD